MHGSFYEDAHIQGTHVRVLTIPLGRDTQSRPRARSRRSTASSAGSRRWLAGLALVGIGLAAGLGLLVARAVLAPVQRLTRAAEDVSETGDLSQRIDATGKDELSRLAATFNTMLGALEDSARSQRQLVSDASHELRTPLTSLRTNIEVLARDEALPPSDREQLLRDVTEQLTEMTALIAELVELARGDLAPADPEDVRLDLVTADAIERTRRNRPGVTFKPELAESMIRGRSRRRSSVQSRTCSTTRRNGARRTARSKSRSATASSPCVTTGRGSTRKTCRTSSTASIERPTARGMPGSGLGLAIARQVAEANGGSVTAERPDGGGTLMRLTLLSKS